ncbi:MAG TPA: YjaG family protein [Marinobacterium sp.]|nr:YjaG family protein [Marinobacterium sp.]
MISENRFEQQIRALEPWQQMLFATALTERMFLNFALFSRLMNFGDLDRMGNLLNSIWEEQTQRGTKVNYEVQLNHVEDNIVDLDEYDMFGAIPARDAMMALFSTIVLKLEQESDEAVAVSNLSYDTIGAYIEFAEADDQMSDEELVRLINMHDLMQDEDAFQEELLERLKGAKFKPALVEGIRELAENQGVSNIGISDEE